MPDGSYRYGLEDLKTALDFALISEGALNSDKIYEETNVLKVRLQTLINSNYSKYFDCPDYVSLDGYIKYLQENDDELPENFYQSRTTKRRKDND